jgi:hypothetical protein
VKIQTNLKDTTFEDMATLTVGSDSEFFDNDGTQQVISFQLYVVETDHEIFLDAELGTVTSNDIIRALKTYYPNLEQLTLVGHFNRAEFSALADGRDLLLGGHFFESSKTIGGKTPIDGVEIEFYDTQHFFAGALEHIGRLIGIPKADISPYTKDKMDIFYAENPALFYRYAMTDAKITAKALVRMRELVDAHFGLDRLPKTAGAIGARCIGRELKKAPERARNLGYYVSKKTVHQKGSLLRFRGFIVKRGIENRFQSAYYGGRNETYLRGLITDTIVTDYDLVSAYTTAQSVVGEYEFQMESENHSLFFTDPRKCYDHLAANPFDFGYVLFSRVKHRSEVNFPIIPSKVDDNVVFTLGESEVVMTSHEFLAAYPTFELTEGFQAVIYRRIEENSAISEFQQQIRDLRRTYKETNDEFANIFLKNIGNSTYGKFYQGYAGKNSLDFNESSRSRMRSRPVPKSEISNPFIAAFITGLIRAIAFETLNELDRIGIKPLYWTTDGFAVIGEVPDHILAGQFGLISKAVSDLMKTRTGSGILYEQKHKGKGWLGIKIRGYGMLEPLDGHKMLTSFTGIQTKHYDDKTAFILDEFKNLTTFKKTKYPSSSLTSIRSWLEGEEFRNKTELKSYNWDYDLKRIPDMNTARMVNGHLYFETIPHPVSEYFKMMKSYYHAFQRGKKHYTNKMITMDDLTNFLEYCDFRDSCDDGYITNFTHLKYLANFMKYTSKRKIGYRIITNLLDAKESTVKNRWLSKQIAFSKPKLLLPMIIKKFNLTLDIVNIVTNGLQTAIQGIYMSKCNPSSKCSGVQIDNKGIYKEFCDPRVMKDRISKLYNAWALNTFYSIEMFNYLVEFIIHLNKMIYKPSDKIDDNKNDPITSDYKAA